MSLRETLQAEVDRLSAAHEKNRVAYRKAAEEERAIAKQKRALNDVASASANELAAAKKALAELDKREGRKVVGSGQAKAGSVKH